MVVIQKKIKHKVGLLILEVKRVEQSSKYTLVEPSHGSVKVFRC